MSADATDFLPGDLAACYGADFTSRTICYGTAALFAPHGLRIGPSHIAILARHNDADVWIESTTLASRACVVTGRHVAGVQAHLPAERIDDYCRHGGAVHLYRLVKIEQLSRDETELLRRILVDHFIRSSVRYDWCGALLSGTRVFQLSRFFPGADLHQLFCSELVAAVLMRLGRLPRGNPTRFNPARLLRTLVRNGTYRLERRWETRR